MSVNKARAFLEDILAHPDDDTPRLILADWLEEERGDSARAEFIRVQIERTRLPKWDARQVGLRLREQALIAQHGQKWREELPRIKGIGTWGFRRGFVGTATFSSFAVLQANASACWAAAPLEAISIRGPRRHEAIASIPPLAGLRELSIENSRMDGREVGQLADAPLLSTLRTLTISKCHLGTEGFRRLVASPHLRNLTALRTPLNFIGNGGVSALFDAAALDSLEELDLSEVGGYGRYGEDPIMEEVGLTALAGWPGMTRLRSLKLSGNDVGQGGLRALLRSPRATGLKELVLRENGFFGSVMQEFSKAHSELQLDALDLGMNLLSNQGAAKLASAPCLRELKVLELNRCEIELAGARSLAKAPFLGTLRRLNVNENLFGPEGLHALLKKKPQELHTLLMADNNLGDEGVSYLANSPASDTLLQVNLAWNELEDEAAETLAKAKHLRNLLVLRLHDNPIGTAALVALSESPLGKRLAVSNADDDEVILF